MSIEHVMLDIETMGTKPGCVIASIGAVKFNIDQGIIDRFYAIPVWEGDMSYDTVRWWLDQSQQARNELLREATGSLKTELEKFLNFAKGCTIWGNGVDFDNVIMSYAAQYYGLKWPYRSNRCYRTVKNMFSVESIRPTIAHDALADAEAQALTLLEIARTHSINLK